MQVSGWDAEDGDIEEEKNPHKSPVTEILWAAENDELDTLRTLLQKDRTLVNVRDKDGYTPLHRACYSGNLKAIDILLEYGADIAAQTDMGWQPLHSACKWNHAECALRLLQHGADVNAKSEGGQTPLHIAGTHSHCKEILQVLLLHPDIQPDVLNVSKESPRQIATRCCKFYPLFDLIEPCIYQIE
ncbi:ankyrin repeat domain-containing protein 49 [Chrysoperla carnea]|uniref:ankyrin repeat domain-containing protein 49 n=1 Tax=Chrysoperla carnea TaxID=189513 RepID=UPI001D0667B1|nr:ankyrin repeat domain-containing protein 49 [Chrysoperla carnea]